MCGQYLFDAESLGGKFRIYDVDFGKMEKHLQVKRWGHRIGKQIHRQTDSVRLYVNA